jgi:hypothetical protein
MDQSLPPNSNQLTLQKDTIKELDRAAAEDAERLREWYIICMESYNDVGLSRKI